MDGPEEALDLIAKTTSVAPATQMLLQGVLPVHGKAMLRLDKQLGERVRDSFLSVVLVTDQRSCYLVCHLDIKFTP